MNNRAIILSHLGRARRALQRAAGWREVGEAEAYRLAMLYARGMLQCARDAMAAAPASTRRRWKHAETIKARKRQARKAHAVADAWGFERIGPYANL